MKIPNPHIDIFKAAAVSTWQKFSFVFVHFWSHRSRKTILCFFKLKLRRVFMQPRNLLVKVCRVPIKALWNDYHASVLAFSYQSAFFIFPVTPTETPAASLIVCVMWPGKCCGWELCHGNGLKALCYRCEDHALHGEENEILFPKSCRKPDRKGCNIINFIWRLW